MKTTLLRFIAAIILLMLPILYFYMSRGILPESVPLHYGMDGQPDRFGHPNELLKFLWIQFGIGLFIYVLLTNLDKIDPKSQGLQSKKLINKILFTVVIFTAIIGVYMVYSSQRGVSENFIFILIGGFFAIIGNFMNNIKPNYFIGIRTPWTLESSDNWRETHRLAARIWTPAGILLSILAIIVPTNYMKLIFMSGISIMVLIPLVFSFAYFRRSR